MMGSKPTDASLAAASIDDKTVDAFTFLDKLREGSDTNMWGASIDLAEQFDLRKETSKKLLTAWMHTFSTALTAGERVTTAGERNLLPNLTE